jgi:hypothetical protein
VARIAANRDKRDGIDAADIAMLVAKRGALAGVGKIVLIILAACLVFFALFIIVQANSSAQGCDTFSAAGGNDNTKIVFDYLAGQPELTPPQAAGIAGNLSYESGGWDTESILVDNPDPKSGATGIAHWLGQRLTNLKNHIFAGPEPAVDKKRPWKDINYEVDYLWDELKYNTSASGNALAIVRQTTNIADATQKFEAAFERAGAAGVASWPDRISTAEKILQKYGGDSVSSTSLDSLACDAGVNVGPGGLTNPFPQGWEPGRLDMGYDGTFLGKIVAPFSGTITFASSSWSNWGGYMELRADGPVSGLPTRTLYFAEGIIPTVLKGHVDAGEKIADPTPSVWNGINGNIEWGVAQDLPANVNSGVTDTYAKVAPNRRQMVLDFADWAVQRLHLGPPNKTSDAGYP